MSHPTWTPTRMTAAPVLRLAHPILPGIVALAGLTVSSRPAQTDRPPVGPRVFRIPPARARLESRSVGLTDPMIAATAKPVPARGPRPKRCRRWISMFTIAMAVLVADVASKLWAVSQLPYLHETRGPAGVGLLLVFNRTPSYDLGHVAMASLLLLVIKFLVLGYLGWRLRGRWRAIGLGLILGGAAANAGNWVVTHAVADFLVMPWATVNLADLFIVLGSAVVVIGSGTQAHAHYTAGTLKVRRRLSGKSVSTKDFRSCTSTFSRPATPAQPLETARRTSSSFQTERSASVRVRRAA